MAKEILNREVRIKGKGDLPSGYEVVDVVTGEIMEDVRCISVNINVDDRPRITIEQSVFGGPELDIQAKATIKVNNRSFKDKDGGIWLKASSLAEMIRNGGVMCSRGKDKAVAYEFTEELLREWEGKKPAPAVG